MRSCKTSRNIVAGLGYLFLESKVFELLSVYLSEVLELSILSPSTYVAISRSDRDSIIEAKRIIDSQLALAPSCEELARQVNISTLKIDEGLFLPVSEHRFMRMSSTSG